MACDIPHPDERGGPAVRYHPPGPHEPPDRIVHLSVAEWLAEGGVDAERIEPLAGDVSSRSYFRVHPRGSRATLIVARYPRELARAQERFQQAAELLERAGVRVPRRLRDDPGAGYALLEDLGPKTLYELAPNWTPLATELDAALAAAATIARLPAGEVEALGSEPLAEPLLRRELAQTIEVFLAPRELATPELLAALDELCARLGAEPLVPCHRDFMARNLIPDGRGGVGVLDFQDLRLGPAAYDLASLLNDSLFAGPELEARVIGARLALVGGWEAYRRAVAQRSLKAIGTFIRFASTGRRRHLRLVETTLACALRQLVRLPETSAVVQPLLAKLEAAGAAAAGARSGLD